MKDYNEEQIAKNMKDGLDDLDQKILVNTPDIARFREMISQVEFAKAKNAKKDVITFIFVAVILLFIETYGFHQSILFFIIIQSFAGTSCMIGLLYYLLKRIKKVKPI